MENVIVVKVGGSLFDHSALGPGLRRWIREFTDGRLVLVPGGGLAAEAVRQLHRVHQPPEEFSHWLAIRMMDANGELLKHLLSDSVEIIDSYEFCQQDEGQQLALPHTWRVTSDSIAARIAEHFRARELVMLKSIDLPRDVDWRQAAELGLIDQMFGEVVERNQLNVRWVNFRKLLDGFSSEPGA
jgi:aspartokinase-like uncharacterized kinase